MSEDLIIMVEIIGGRNYGISSKQLALIKNLENARKIQEEI